MKKILSLLLTISLTVNLYAIEKQYTEKDILAAYSDGFNLAFKSLNAKEFKIQGLKEEPIDFEEFMVVVDGSGLDDAKRFSTQLIGWKRDDSVRILYGNWIVLSSFSRKANAQSYIREVNRKYFNMQPKNRQAFLYQKPIGKVFYKEKSFFSKIAEEIVDDVKKETKVLFIQKDDKRSKKKNTFIKKKNTTIKVLKKNNSLSRLNNLNFKKSVEKKNIDVKNLDKKIELSEKKSRESFKKSLEESKKRRKEKNKELTRLKADKKRKQQTEILLEKEEFNNVFNNGVEDITPQYKKGKVVNVVFSKQKVRLYDLPDDLKSSPVNEKDFIIIGNASNSGKTYLSAEQKRASNGQIFYYIDEIKAWVKKQEIIEL